MRRHAPFCPCGVFGGADSFVFRNLYQEDVTCIVAQHQTVEIECAGHGDRWLNQSSMEVEERDLIRMGLIAIGARSELA